MKNKKPLQKEKSLPKETLVASQLNNLDWFEQLLAENPDCTREQLKEEVDNMAEEFGF